AGPSGLAQWTLTFDGFAADFDGNGYRDVFYSRHGNQAPRLAMNGPGGFLDAPTDAFSPVDRHGCDSADVDLDGNRDILCAVGASRGKAIKRHEITLAPDKATRALATGTRGISDPLGRGRDVGFIHLDGDAYPEVFITNAPDRDDGLPGYNRFYRNAGGTFVPAPGIGLDNSHSAQCLETGDLDMDGDEDLAYCAAYGFARRPAGLRFLRNEGGRLQDRTRALGITPIADIDAAFADVTGDGQKDLIQLSGTRLRISKETRGGYRVVFEARLTDGVALAAGDASGDGVADIYVVRGNDDANKPDLLLISQNGARDLVSVEIPQTVKGSADDVVALDYDQNGLTDFVVLNGRRKAGPVQLLAAFPA
ncbi:MAG TPA: VCBS repeat-containing protein, partial [Candidatus Limnocylindrales bacterium]|nr:VCBS repeat-containing protein [Candidatus Limnocylindrales bacterium]